MWTPPITCPPSLCRPTIASAETVFGRQMSAGLTQNASSQAVPESPSSLRADFERLALHDPLDRTIEDPHLLTLGVSGHSSTISPPVVPAEPVAVSTNPLGTPEEQAEQTLGLFETLHGPIPPLPSPNNATQTTKLAQPLRLPSFNLLGIGAFHPKYWETSHTSTAASLEAGSPVLTNEHPLETSNPPFAHDGASPSYNLGDPLAKVNSEFDPTRDILRSPLHQVNSLITPPDDIGHIDWKSQTGIHFLGVHSPAESGEGEIASGTGGSSVGGSETGAGPTPAPALDISMMDPVQETADVLVGVVTQFFLPTPASQSGGRRDIKVLSHILPCPSTAGHVFPIVIKQIQEQVLPTQVTWINVTHAVPYRLSLADLPTSPPPTPAAPLTGNDYFSSKVFDSAVGVVDYQLGELPSFLRPAVSPESLHLSVCERYIPPTNTNEFQQMFSINGPSLLVDRLIELSPEKGRLLFIYPTQSGGRTFMKEYLGPVLDPILRSMVVLHGLSPDLSSRIGHMASVNALYDFHTMDRSIRYLCSRLSESGSAERTFGGPNTTYQVIHSASERVELPRKAWAQEWWVKQEKGRIKKLVEDNYTAPTIDAREKQHPPTHGQISETILQGVASKPSDVSGGGIEIGVFVIERAALD
ncbi:MAG: hypothetical protein M1820_003564 [Bogoriella megaspora]|nr:MAG: hypothetical protein M1820_003564 [Bogoriella megaspora]